MEATQAGKQATLRGVHTWSSPSYRMQCKDAETRGVKRCGSMQSGHAAITQALELAGLHGAAQPQAAQPFRPASLKPDPAPARLAQGQGQALQLPQLLQLHQVNKGTPAGTQVQ